MRVKQQASKSHVQTTNATVQIKIGHGVLRRVIFATPVASSTVKIIDDITGTTATFTITNTTDVKPYVLEMGFMFHLGLRIITSGADNVVFVYD